MHETDKRLILRIYKEILQFNKKKTDNPIIKWVTDFNTLFKKGYPKGQ